jgi:hydrogenase nickel incorporation protein HypA/HybF
MHEVGLMHQALGIAQDTAARHGAERIIRLTLRVGAHSGVVPEALTFAFEALSPGTAAEGAALVIEPVAVVCHCSACDRDFEPPDFTYECPACCRVCTDVRRGRELEVCSLEVA